MKRTSPSTTWVKCSLPESRPTLCRFHRLLKRFQSKEFVYKKIGHIIPLLSKTGTNSHRWRGACPGRDLGQCISQDVLGDAAERPCPVSGTRGSTHLLSGRPGSSALSRCHPVSMGLTTALTQSTVGPRGRGTARPVVCWHFMPPPANDWCHPYSHSTGHGHLTVLGKRRSYQVLEGARTPHLRAGVSEPEMRPVSTGSHGQQASYYTVQSLQLHRCFQLKSLNITSFSLSFFKKKSRHRTYVSLNPNPALMHVYRVPQRRTAA